jgi:hypothetical protein
MTTPIPSPPSSPELIAREHELKTWPEFYRHLVSGEKTFELRKDDRGFRVGDVLWLREWQRLSVNPTTGEYTGRESRYRVTYVLSGIGIEPGYVVLGIAALAAAPVEPEPTKDDAERRKLQRGSPYHIYPALTRTGRARRAAMTFNRLADPADFSLSGLLLEQHPLVTDETLQGQHPIRAWEYTQALRAVEAHVQRNIAQIYADIGGAGSNFWKLLSNYFRLGYRIDPNHEWAGAEDKAALAFRETLAQFKASEELQIFERDLVSLVRPGGLLVLTCDAAPSHPDQYHFHWMRKRIYTPDGLAALAQVFEQTYGMQLLGEPADFRWHGPTVYDYTVASLALVKPKD